MIIRDLKVIFSQFGKIKGCNLVRDWKTNDSLQYAFIEFETAKACEDAYFKMDNVLIDNCRIHVDFSQSVSRLWNQFNRGRVRKQEYYADLRKRDNFEDSEDKAEQRKADKKRQQQSDTGDIVQFKPKYDPDREFELVARRQQASRPNLAENHQNDASKSRERKKQRPRKRSTSSDQKPEKAKKRKRSESRSKKDKKKRKNTYDTSEDEKPRKRRRDRSSSVSSSSKSRNSKRKHHSRKSTKHKKH